MPSNSDRDQERSAEVEFGLTLRRAQHVLAQRLDEALRPSGLNLGLWAVLRETAGQPGASASELARATFHTPQTLSGLLQRLDDRGLVERSSGRGRIVDNHVTDEGHRALAAVTPRAEAVIADALAAFDPQDRAVFHRLLTEFADALTRQ
ncbi:MarR family winged helix-turn-helix transcriptional regulator [Streptacidiphilus fuscans]|uniref:Winged helix-turn-helix transcriptional regulator n=1 Tax=Streptacidiphilus fuscans TaxID=2789292 RepID=A0A931B912_9ACTN|nr:MarR family winged helix-turn-helix transcriptional regulator [Streptacidiphilus fuscans]MBF9069861.1 winged helix-turn-helix transcriptional regulator [Streptacidiphilus fuscans]MBF9073465.1 winged helix-turn-helix transcriptional regulator [Streptacidiphilus fuscans]